MPSTLETLWRSSGSNVSSVPDPASTTSPPASIRAEPETTISQARSRTWCSPSSSPGARRMMIARAPSTVSRASARRVPSGTSISFTFHVCTGSDSRRSRILLLALLPEAWPKARKLPTRYGARDVGAQANRIRHAGPASRFDRLGLAALFNDGGSASLTLRRAIPKLARESSRPLLPTPRETGRRSSSRHRSAG